MTVVTNDALKSLLGRFYGMALTKCASPVCLWLQNSLSPFTLSLCVCQSCLLIKPLNVLLYVRKKTKNPILVVGPYVQSNPSTEVLKLQLPLLQPHF